MKGKSIIHFALALSVVSALVGCGAGSGYSEPSGTWDNYKCTASSAGGDVSVGWATSESRARDNALDKCRAHASSPDACKIEQCNGS